MCSGYSHIQNVNISLTKMHHAYLNIAQNIGVLFYCNHRRRMELEDKQRFFYDSNPQGRCGGVEVWRCGGRFFPCFCVSPFWQWLAKTVYQLADFFKQFCRHFRAPNLADFPSYSQHISTFSLILKGFNVGQESAIFMI